MSRSEPKEKGAHTKDRESSRKVRNESTLTESLQVSPPSSRSKHDAGENFQSTNRSNTPSRAKPKQQKSSKMIEKSVSSKEHHLHKPSKNQIPSTPNKENVPETPGKEADIPYNVYYLPGGILYAPEGYLDSNGLPTNQALAGRIVHIQATKTAEEGGENIFIKTGGLNIDNPPTPAGPVNRTHSPHRDHFSSHGTSPTRKLLPSNSKKHTKKDPMHQKASQTDEGTSEPLQPATVRIVRHSSSKASQTDHKSLQSMQHVAPRNQSSVPAHPILQPAPQLPHAHCHHKSHCHMAPGVSVPPAQAGVYSNPALITQGYAYYPQPAQHEYQLSQVTPEHQIQPVIHYSEYYPSNAGIRLENLPHLKSGHVPLYYYQKVSRPFAKKDEAGMWGMASMPGCSMHPK